MLLSFFLMVGLYHLIPEVNALILDLNTQLVMPKGTPIKGAKGEIETHPLTVEMKIRKCAK